MRIRLAFLVMLTGCGSGSIGDETPDAPLGMTPDAPIGNSDASSSDGPPGSNIDARGSLLNDAGQPLCDSKSGGLVVCECADGINNDDDGLIDAADPECVGPYDNDESSYATGIPGDNSDPYVQDCFFDGDSGGGNDGCRWDIRCVPPDDNHCNNNQLEGCDTCRPLVPNGCDCFGCCDVYIEGVAHGPVRIIETCTADVIDDPTKCPVCTKVTECQNTCEPCEVCIGRPEDPSCTPDAGSMQCPAGVIECGPPDFSCPSEHRCITGCCVRYVS